MSYQHPEYLISAADLHTALEDPKLRVFDTAVYLRPQEHGYLVESGREPYEAGHIPGAGFIDLAAEWADTESPLRFTIPSVDDLAAAIGASGIDNTSRVVLYSNAHLMWATRAWWLLYYAGHRNMAVLNGNLAAWKAAGYALETGSSGYPPARFEPNPEAARIASTGDVEAGLHGRVCTINALSRSVYEGTGDVSYGRRGHIPGSKLVYYDSVLQAEHFLPPENLAKVLEAEGMLSADSVITYCGGGIAATLDAFACVLCGQENVAVYDGSMSEWVLDEDRPLTTGATP